MGNEYTYGPVIYTQSADGTWGHFQYSTNGGPTLMGWGAPPPGDHVEKNGRVYVSPRKDDDRKLPTVPAAGDKGIIAARKTASGKVPSTNPDIKLRNKVPAAYQTHAKMKEARKHSPNVLVNSENVIKVDSHYPKTYGGEQGTDGGRTSKTYVGKAHPKSGSPVAHANGSQMVRHGDPHGINGPRHNPNTDGVADIRGDQSPRPPPKLSDLQQAGQFAIGTGEGLAEFGYEFCAWAKDYKDKLVNLYQANKAFNAATTAAEKEKAQQAWNKARDEALEPVIAFGNSMKNGLETADAFLKDVKNEDRAKKGLPPIPLTPDEQARVQGLKDGIRDTFVRLENDPNPARTAGRMFGKDFVGPILTKKVAGVVATEVKGIAKSVVTSGKPSLRAPRPKRINDISSLCRCSRRK